MWFSAKCSERNCLHDKGQCMNTTIKYSLFCNWQVNYLKTELTERFLLQPLVSGTVFHHMSLLPPSRSFSPSSAVVLNHISSHFLNPFSDSSLICTVSVQWLVILHTIIVITFLQRVSIACYAERCISYDRFCPTVWPSDCPTVCHSPVSCQNDSSYCGLQWRIAPWF